MFCENNCALPSVVAPVGGAAACVTVTRAVASVVPLSFFATRRYVVDSVGVTRVEPLGSTLPIPSMLISLAKSVFQVRVEASPALIVLGFVVNMAVGAGGLAAGGGGGGGGCFFLQPAARRIKANAGMM